MNILQLLTVSISVRSAFCLFADTGVSIIFPQFVKDASRRPMFIRLNPDTNFIIHAFKVFLAVYFKENMFWTRPVMYFDAHLI